MQKKGFTLIELMIVMCIIGLLTVIAVSSYTGVQRQARVDFAADTLVSAIREVQVMARSGRRAEGRGFTRAEVLQCYAVRIVTGTKPGAGLYTSQTGYIAVEGEVVDTCRIVQGIDNWKKSEVFGENVVLIGAGEEKIYYFKPPFGQILQEVGGVLNRPASQKLVLTVGDVLATEFNRTVEFDLSTGLVKRI